MAEVVRMAYFGADGITDTLHLVIDSGTLVCGAVTQHIGTQTLYIESLDTTGHFSPRAGQKHVVSSLVGHILDQQFALFAVFSHPKHEIIFGKSSLNSAKGYLPPRRLQAYWISLFARANVFVFSNFCEKRSLPFRSMDDVVFFHDDPKRKLGVRDVDVHTFFEMLLHRRDFQGGALIYMCKEPATPFAKINSNAVLDHKQHGSVREAVSFLRNSDFSTPTDARASTEQFLAKFGCIATPFDVASAGTPSAVEQKPVVLVPTRKR